MNPSYRLPVALVAGLLLTTAGPARAKDVWTDLNPAVRYLKRTSGDQTYHVVTVQLVVKGVSLRATKHGERRRTTSSFARQVKAVVAINGDQFAPGSFAPRGLAVGDGERWPGAEDSPERRFIACDAHQRCEIEGPGKRTALQTRWSDVVGGGGAALISGGVVRSSKEDERCGKPCTDNRSWTAVGLNQPRTTLYLAVTEGRRKGPTLRELGLVLRDLGAHEAISLDSGAHSTMVVDGKRVNAQGEAVVSNHLGVRYQAPEDGCTMAARVACSKYGCTCVDGKCNGGFCPGDGCTEAARLSCAGQGCRCVDMQCSGGACPGTGCTARATQDCHKSGCACADGVCAGRMCPGSGCTARKIKDCTRYGCACVDGNCSGGYCPGTGCTERQTAECARTGCACVDGKCSGGHCPGSGCTPTQTKNCAKVGCACVDGVCSGGFCDGLGCTARRTAECMAKGCRCVDGTCAGGECAGAGCTAKQASACKKMKCGCVNGVCSGGQCTGSGCGFSKTGDGCACELGQAPRAAGGAWAAALLALVVVITGRRRRARPTRSGPAAEGP